MTTNENHPGRSAANEGGAQERAEDVAALYADRLIAGERIDSEEILRAHPSVGREVLDQLAVFVDLDVNDDNQPLGQLGDYTLRRRIGRGGMGVVYQAWENSMDRPVALKVLPPGISADPQASARFLREAQTAGKLNHPNVVRVYFTGVKDQTPFYAMELIEGETLAQILAKTKDAEPETETPFGKKDCAGYFEQIARVFADVADGLQHAHSKGVTHRDIKPSNLILDLDGRLRVLDFGLALLEGQESLTRSGEFVGTPLYMSPEQARRKRIPVDYRTDVYSFGATLYEALCGRPPFRGKSHADTLSQIIERDPVELRTLNSRVPKDLDRIVLKCLRKDPADRYGTAEALGQDLRRFVRGAPVEASPVVWRQRIGRSLWRRRRLLAIMPAVVSAAALSIWLFYARRAAEQESLIIRYEPVVRQAAGRLLAGRFSLQAGHPESRTLLRLSQTSIQPMGRSELQSILSFGEAGSLQEIAVKLEGVAPAKPESPDAPYWLAQAYFALGQSQAARLTVEKILEQHESFVPARLLLWELEGAPRGTAGLEFGVLLDDAKRARRSHSDTGQIAWEELWIHAEVAFRERRWIESARAFRDLAALGDFPFIGAAMESHLKLGVSLLEGGQYAEAPSSFAAASALSDSEIGGLEPALLHARAYHVRGDEEIAENDLKRLWRTRNDPVSRECVSVLAFSLYTVLGDHKRALSWAQQLEGPGLRRRLEAHCLLRLDQNQQAVETASLAMEHDRDDPYAPAIAACALYRDLWSRARDVATYRADVERLVELARIASRLKSEASELLAAAEELATLTIDDSRRSETERSELITAGTATTVGTEQAPLGDNLGRFEDCRPLNELNSIYTEWSPTVTRDGRFVVFASNRLLGDSVDLRAGLDLWASRREHSGESFGKPYRLDRVNSEVEDTNPSLAFDGRTLLFASTRAGGLGAADLYVAERRLGDAEFGIPRNLGSRINTNLPESLGQTSADGLNLYFTRAVVGTRFPIKGDSFVANRPHVDVPWDDASVDVAPLSGLNTELYHEGYVSLASSGDVLFFSEFLPIDPAGPGGTDLWAARRTGPGAADFGFPVLLDFCVNTSTHEYTPWISADWPDHGAKLWFARSEPGNVQKIDIYEATWIPGERHRDSGR